MRNTRYRILRLCPIACKFALLAGAVRAFLSGNVALSVALVAAFFGAMWLAIFLNHEIIRTEYQRGIFMQVNDKKAIKKADDLAAVIAAIGAMPEPDRAIAERLHAVIMTNAPDLSPKTWYGMPAYAKDDKIVCFFRSKQKFKERYMTLGFNDAANLDEGVLWPISFALKELTADAEEKVGAMMKKAVR